MLRYITNLFFIHSQWSWESQRHCENERVDSAARTVARYRRRGAASKFLHGRIGVLERESRVQSRWPFILPTSRTRTGRRCPTWALVALAWRATAARTCTRPSGRSNTFSLYCHFICRPLADQPVAFTFAPAATRASSQIRGFLNPLVPLLPPVLCPLPPCPRGKGTEYRRVHSRCTLTVTPHRIHTIWSVHERMRSYNQHYWRHYGPATATPSMSPPPPSLKYMTWHPRYAIPFSLPRDSSHRRNFVFSSTSLAGDAQINRLRRLIVFVSVGRLSFTVHSNSSTESSFYFLTISISISLSSCLRWRLFKIFFANFKV